MDPQGTKSSSLGSSLLVPCVQELIKEPLVSVPPRYIRPDQDCSIVAAAAADDDEVPVIDLQRLYDHDSMDSELAKLHCACKYWGFFQVLSFIFFFSSKKNVEKSLIIMKILNLVW